MNVSLPEQEPLDTAEQLLVVDPRSSLELREQELQAGVKGFRRARSLYLGGSALQRLERADEGLRYLSDALKLYVCEGDMCGQVADLMSTGLAQLQQWRS